VEHGKKKGKARGATKAAKAAKNPITMMTVGALAGNPRKRAKRARKNPASGGLIRISRGPVRAAAHVDGYRENVAGCKQFHDVAPVRDRVFDFDDGKQEITERVVFAMGDAEVTFNVVKDADGNEVQIPMQKISSAYRVRGKRSSKAGRQFIHSATEDGGRSPLRVCDARTHIMSELGDYEVTDYIRERGA